MIMKKIFVLSFQIVRSFVGRVEGYGIPLPGRGVRLPRVGAKRAALLRADVEFVQAVFLQVGVDLHLVNSQT